MEPTRVIVVGGGAAGFLAAITCAESRPEMRVVVLEKAEQFLGKVRISGGGRCNVTHALFDPRAFTANYPRGARELIGPFHRFQASDTVEWFRARGVALKTEPDGRMFPTTDSSETIVDCLLGSARAAGVELRGGQDVARVTRAAPAGFAVELGDGTALACDRLLLATGGTRSGGGARIAESLGHTLTPAVPSLFSLDVDSRWLGQLPGVSMQDVELSLPGTQLRERGPLLITHRGVSGPVVLRLSAWGARLLHERNYAATLQVNWLPAHDAQSLEAALRAVAAEKPGKPVTKTPLAPVPARLWERIALGACVKKETRWASLSRAAMQKLIGHLLRMELAVKGKSTNKDEFVTCGGVSLREVDLRTMESRICPGLFFAGEVLDIDAITGGFNFQSAWTTGFVAGKAIGGD